MGAPGGVAETSHLQYAQYAPQCFPGPGRRYRRVLRLSRAGVVGREEGARARGTEPLRRGPGGKALVSLEKKAKLEKFFHLAFHPVDLILSFRPQGLNFSRMGFPAKICDYFPCHSSVRV